MAHQSLLLWLGVMAAPLGAQQWNDSATVRLVGQAVERRSSSFADSTLHHYSARARGVLTFRAELGIGAGSTSRLVKGDEVQVEVYWQRPNRSKQIIRAWRDSTFFPTDLSYHRDHLGIVTDDFGPAIRIGDGDEVRDVVHPLAPAGPALYDYRLGDTISLRSPGSALVLIELEIRPKDERTSAAVGRLFLDRDRLQVVRSDLSFTPAAYVDRELEDIVVRLERAMYEGRYWLPFRQVIEIRRRTAVVDLPFRTVIRGDWSIDEHEVNGALPPIDWSGPSVGGLRRPAVAGWATGLGRAIDSSLGLVSRDLEAVRGEVAQLARSRLLDGLPRLRPGVSRVSDALRFNRVEGLAVGIGLTWRGRVSDEARLSVGYGFADRRLTGRAEARWTLGSASVALLGERLVVDVGDFAGMSRLANSLASQELGSDFGDYVLRERVGVALAGRSGPGLATTASLGWERPASLDAIAVPARGAFRPNPALGAPGRWIGRVGIERRRSALAGPAWQFGIAAEAGFGSGGYGRLIGVGRTEVAAPGGSLVARGALGFATSKTPAWRSFAVGGPGTLVGERFRGFGGRHAAWGALEWLARATAPTLSFGWFGKTSGEIRIGPALGLGWAGGPIAEAPWRPSRGLRPVAGLVGEFFDQAVRVEIGWSLTRGGSPGLTIDFSPVLWPVL